MKKVIKLTESDLTNLVSKIVNENLYDNDLYSKIIKVLSNSNSSHREKLEILYIIIDEMESAQKMRSRMRGDMFESENKEKNTDLIEIYHLYKEGKISKKHFYSFMEITTKEEKQELIDYIENQKDF